MRYALGRLAYGFTVFAAVSVLTFSLLELAPGEFFDDLKTDARVAPETVESLRERYGLTEPAAVRYVRWVRSVLAGDLGFSLAHREPVSSLIWDRARNSLLLTVPAMLLTWTIGLPLGIWMAQRRGRWSERICGAAASSLVGLPDLLIALLLLLLALKTGLFPTGGMLTTGASDLGAIARLRDLAMHAVLPICAVVASTLPAVLRHVRASVIEAIDASPVQAARGHGIRSWRLTLRYIVPMAANPLISLAGLSVAALLSASLLIEVVMGWPGLGPLLVEALLAKDVHVVLGASMLATLFLITGNLLADLALFAVDPRIRA